MMLEANRRPLHMAAAFFLEELIRQCSDGNQLNAAKLNERYFFEDADTDKAEQQEDMDSVESPTASVDDRQQHGVVNTSLPSNEDVNTITNVPEVDDRRASRLLSIMTQTVSHQDIALLAAMAAKNNSTVHAATAAAAAAAASLCPSSFGDQSDDLPKAKRSRRRGTTNLSADLGLHERTKQPLSQHRVSGQRMSLFFVEGAKRRKNSRPSSNSMSNSKDSSSTGSKLGDEHEDMFLNVNAWDSLRGLTTIYPEIVDQVLKILLTKTRKLSVSK